jgi:hypothetical protein
MLGNGLNNINKKPGSAAGLFVNAYLRTDKSCGIFIAPKKEKTKERVLNYTSTARLLRSDCISKARRYQYF